MWRTVFDPPSHMERAENTGFLPFLFDKTYKKCAHTAFFLEKMKKMRRERKKIEKNLDIILAKCYNMLYCR